MAKLNSSYVSSLLMIIIMLVISFQALADTAADVGYAADNITAQSAVYPLTSFFKKKGVVLLALMAGVAISIISAVMKSGK